MNFTTAQRRNIVVLILVMLIIAISIIAIKEPAPATKRVVSTAPVDLATAKGKALPTMRNFDPNEATLKEFLELGVEKKIAVSIIRYREAGKIFRIKEDLALCYDMTDSLYFALEPYIKIGQKYQYKKQEFAATDNVATQQSAFIPREKKPAIEFPIDINKADSATLRAVRGIGEKTAVAIVQYRALLGGFHSIEQIGELNVITESNYEQILTQIFANNEDISKIDANFTPANELIRHPYITQMMARRWISKLQLKGGYATIEEMIDDNIFNREEATKLQPYLQF